ncbi:DNRLRE domain-containing protein [Clostridium saudiense]|uniref:DNRLRE domain-containing protein n=2 Tax=Clostridium TaxID=1485 RepID=A0ABS2FET8_9CLOT|nr:DNRLRE domain-containing protein [Clostridium saudiense]MBM6818993.1 DNRLRE domain-containing protein [Clostridium saudiense]
MKNSNKIICSAGTTINKSNLKINLKNNNLFVGIIYNNFNTKNEYLTILNFDLCNINLNSFDSAFLNLYIKDSKFINNKPILVSICENLTSYDDLLINPQFISKTRSTSNTNIKINSYDINKYIKIDITPILISILSNNRKSSLIVKSLNSTLNTIINFDSLYSDNPPFIELINLNETNIDLEFTNFKNSINNKISKLTNIVDLNTVNLNTIKNEFSQTINKVNTDINKSLQNTDDIISEINTITSNLSNDISLINESISMILDQIDILNKELDQISITPIDLNNL